MLRILYKTLVDSLPHISFATGELPQTLKRANISLVLKKGKVLESCAAYRPIALLKVDRKLLSKILDSPSENLLLCHAKERPGRSYKGLEFGH